MERITYKAPNLMDWVAQLKSGAATVRVHFTGGALTAYGVTPARYTTSNPFIQKVIEQSEHFKEGRIEIDRRVVLDSSDASLRSRTGQPRGTGDGASPCSRTVKPAAVTGGTAEASPEVPEVADGGTAEASPEVPEVADGGTAEASPQLQEVEVSCLQDAQDYLQQHYGIASYKVRTIAAAQAAASVHGTVFSGGGFGKAAGESESGG